MAIKKKHDLPKQPSRGSGSPPDSEPVAVGALARAWKQDSLVRDAEYERRVKERGSSAVFHISEAGKCSRALSMAALRRQGYWVERGEIDLPGIFSMRLGTELHNFWQDAVAAELAPFGAYVFDHRVEHSPLQGDIWQAAVEEAFAGGFPVVEIEPRLVLEVEGRELASGYIDLRVHIPESWHTFWVEAPSTVQGRWGQWAGKKVVVELKTTGGFSFKIKVGERGSASGPDEGNLTQLALQVKASEADIGVVAYMATESISKGAAEKKGFEEEARFSAEWSYDAEDLVPIADKELERFAAIDGLLREGSMARRMFPSSELPPGAEVVDPMPLKNPSKGRWEQRVDGRLVDTGSWWACGYCSFQGECARQDAGRVPIEFKTADAFLNQEEEE